MQQTAGGSGGRRVAGGAGDLFVPTAQGETAVATVIEQLGQPIPGHMTAVAGNVSAIGGQFVLELACVGILVADGAGGRSADQAQRSRFVVKGEVAGPAGYE